MTNAPAAQQAVERGVEKAAVARFGQDNIARLRYQLIHQLIVPAAFRQQLALQFGPFTHGFQGVRLVEVGRAGAAGLDVLVIPAVLEPDDEHARGARGGDGGFNVLNHRPGGGDVEPRQIQIAALAGVGVLHVHHDQRALLRREGDGFRACVKGRHYATSFVTAGMWARHCISGWMRSPKVSTPVRKSSKVSRTPSAPGTAATSSSILATLA